MALPKMMVRCVLCDSEFQMGPHIYAGTWVIRYKMHVCSPCYQGNWDGYADHYEERILRHLASKGIEVSERNAQGYLLRD